MKNIEIIFGGKATDMSSYKDTKKQFLTALADGSSLKIITMILEGKFACRRHRKPLEAYTRNSY
jgi:hypothetical protein